VDRTNLERQRRWQARHMIRPTQSPEEIAERLRDVLGREKLERVAELIGTKTGANNSAGTGPAAEARATEDDVNNASQPLDRETMRVIGDLFRTLRRSQLKHLCLALMQRLRISAKDTDRDLQREVRSLRARLRKATIAAKLAEYRADHPHA
jgi:hypothetical protein